MRDSEPKQTISVELDLADLATLSTALAGTAAQSRQKAKAEREGGKPEAALSLEELAAQCEKLLIQLRNGPRANSLRPPTGPRIPR
jgi:hypothetical protein